MSLPFTRADALACFDEFLPKAGSFYAKNRNFDFGSGYHDNVSQLSPAIRRRLICEDEIVKKTLSSHRFGAAEKFIQEVFWRTYWKGWLEMRPSLWTDYRNHSTPSVTSAQLEAALAGKTGLACFDAWHDELVTTNYLHNHARMWFASIWIFTFHLPWQAGAHFFMTHLADGCPASNTLGWRWVAGLQTRGKAYAARADNIDQFTKGRFQPYGELEEVVVALGGAENPPATPIAPLAAPAGQKPLLLITAEDCLAETLPLSQAPVAIVSLPADCGGAFRSHSVKMADKIAMQDALSRAEAHYKVPAYALENATTWQNDLVQMANEKGADHTVAAYQPTGYWRDTLTSYTSAASLSHFEVRRAYDSLCWPHAKKGFFPFKEKIPHFIGQL